jgi:hypothetical protein
VRYRAVEAVLLRAVAHDEVNAAPKDDPDEEAARCHLSFEHGLPHRI